MLGIDTTEKVTVRTFGEELSLMERIILKSLRGEGGLTRVLDSFFGGGTAGDQTAAQIPVSMLMDALREDGTLAAVELMDGRPVAMMPFWIKVR